MMMEQCAYLSCMHLERINGGMRRPVRDGYLFTLLNPSSYLSSLCSLRPMMNPLLIWMPLYAFISFLFHFISYFHRFHTYSMFTIVVIVNFVLFTERMEGKQTSIQQEGWSRC